MKVRCFTVLLVGVLALLGPAFAEKGEKQEKKKAKNDPDQLLAKAEDLYGDGKYEKALRTFQLAIDQSEEGCPDCLLGMFRASVARGRFDEASWYSGALLDAAAEGDGDEAAEGDRKKLPEEIEAAFKQALAATEGSDPDVIWGLVDVLGRLGKASEIVRLAERYLETDEEKSLVCAADSRVSLAQREPLALADEINAQLGALEWDGPLLAGSDMRNPKLRNRSYTEGRGARMAGVVDGRGFLKSVRVVRPPPGKITMDVEDKLRRAFFNPATRRGRRIAVCYPFSVTLPGQINLAQGGRSAGEEGGPSALYNLIAGFESADAILELVERAGKEIALPQRAAVCAARDWYDELNEGLVELEWPGPYFDTEAVKDPVPQMSQPPEYTDEAREAKVEGEVVLSAVVSDTGRVVHAEVVKPLPEGLSEKAAETVKSWTFEPAELAGKKVSVCRTITVKFEL